jgi:hypothetical protein
LVACSFHQYRPSKPAKTAPARGFAAIAQFGFNVILPVSGLLSTVLAIRGGFDADFVGASPDLP